MDWAISSMDIFDRWILCSLYADMKIFTQLQQTGDLLDSLLISKYILLIFAGHPLAFNYQILNQITIVSFSRLLLRVHPWSSLPRQPATHWWWGEPQPEGFWQCPEYVSKAWKQRVHTNCGGSVIKQTHLACYLPELWSFYLSKFNCLILWRMKHVGFFSVNSPQSLNILPVCNKYRIYP